MLVDTHCHLHDHEYPLDRTQVLTNATQHDVRQIIVIGTCPSDAKDAQRFANAHANVFWSYGYHPGEPEEEFEFFQDDKLVSIGEIGLDYHYQPYDRSAQIRRFEMMLDLAQRYALPVNLHIREAFADFWPIFDNFHIQKPAKAIKPKKPNNVNQAIFCHGFLIFL